VRITTFSSSKIQGSFPEMQGPFAEIQGSFAETQGSFAKHRASLQKCRFFFAEIYGSFVEIQGCFVEIEPRVISWHKHAMSNMARTWSFNRMGLKAGMTRLYVRTLYQLHTN